VLLSGHHGRIARWRRDEAFRRTTRNRPELIEQADPEEFDQHDRKILAELGWDVSEATGRFGRPAPDVEE
jgi:tRNA (guanine37-N1)-methyltransferase